MQSIPFSAMTDQSTCPFPLTLCFFVTLLILVLQVGSNWMKSERLFEMEMLAPLSQMMGKDDSFGIDVRNLAGAWRATCMAVTSGIAFWGVIMLTCAHIFSAA